MKMHVFILSAAFSLVSAAHAAPPGTRLLALVPKDAQIVTGVKIPHSGETSTSIALVTHDNNIDFSDWLALVSVDPRARGNEAVEVASSSPRGELKERLLLVDGLFDRDHIAKAALQRGAGTAEYAHVPVLILAPLARDRDLGVGVRWMAFPDDRTALFGTPLLVQKALDRRLRHAPVEEALSGRLRQLHAGAEDWGFVAMPAEVFRRNLKNMGAASGILQAIAGSGETVIGVRNSSPATITALTPSTHNPAAETASR